MRRIAVCLSHYSLANSPSIINFVMFLAKSNRVVLFMESVAHTDVPEINRSKRITTRYFGRKCSLDYLRAILQARLSRYDCSIAFDPYGFALSQSLLPDCRVFYYSLELYLRNDHFGLDYPSWLQELERRHINEIKGLIIQSSEKEELFRQDYELSAAVPTLILPVTYSGCSSRQKSTYLRDAMGISPGHRIALHLGAIAEFFSCIELAETFGSLDGWSLVFHGYPQPDYAKKLKHLITEKGFLNIYIHDRQFSSLSDLDELVRSADLGIAWYEDFSIGLRTSGMSSGKIPAYLKFGLPVVAKKYPSTSLALEVPKCGLCVDAHNEIPAALRDIVANYEDFSSAACAEYEHRYRFENYLQSIGDFIGLD